MLKKTLAGWFTVNRRSDYIFTGTIAVVCVLLFFLPTGFERAATAEGISCRAEISAVDNSRVHVIGKIATGEQALSLRILDGRFRGKTVDTVNHFLGKLDLDKFYARGEKVLAVIESEGDAIRYATVIDRYRLDIQFILVLAFMLFLLIYAGWTGFKAILSFVLTALVVWKLLLPGYLNHLPVVPLAVGLTSFMTGGIIFLVGGLNRQGLSAFCGAMSGVLFTCLLALIFSPFFRIPGAILPYGETLLYTGYSDLALGDIFLAGVFIAASGAVMDIAMDVASALTEIAARKPDISTGELLRSGLRIGRAVIGTMTTTLLLAYSSGYSTLLMVFLNQGISIATLLNYQVIAAEILHTIVGSFGLVFTAPLTALCSALILKAGKKKSVVL